MKVNELVESMKKNQNATVKKFVNVKEYVPFEEKVDLVKDIIDTCIENDNGIIRINEIDQYFWFTIKVLQAYTDIEFSIDYYQDYNTLAETGLLGEILNLFKDEYQAVINLLEMQRKYVLEQNRIEFQIAKFLNTATDSLATFVNGLNDKVNDFSTNDIFNAENMKSLENVFGMLKEVANDG
mgnify:CR=1 FL=1